VAGVIFRIQASNRTDSNLSKYSNMQMFKVPVDVYSPVKSNPPRQSLPTTGPNDLSQSMISIFRFDVDDGLQKKAKETRAT
jgi:hypothetical protein